MNDQVRIFRDNPIAWVEKPVLRFLRKKYGKDKKKFVLIKAVYLALCEIESDFQTTPITAFNKTLGTYSGCSREAAGKYINLLIKDGLVSKIRLRDSKTKKYIMGTNIEIKSFKSIPTISEPLSAYANNGVSQHRDTQTLLKNISKPKNINLFKNVNDISIRDTEEIGYYAKVLADKLGDSKSLSFYKIACSKHNPHQLIQKAQEIAQTENIKNKGAVFVNWLKTLKVN